MNTPIERLKLSEIMEIAELASFTIVDPENDVDNTDAILGRMSPRWINVVLRSGEQLDRRLQRLNEKVNIYVFLSRTFSAERYYGLRNWDSKFERFGIKKDSSAINCIITDYVEILVSDNMPPTPWMMLHMICHPLFDRNDTLWRDMWVGLIKDMYGLSPAFFSKTIIPLMQNLFTFRAARLNNIGNIDEGLIELMVQYIVQGKITRNEIPLFKDVVGVEHEPFLDADEAWDRFSKKFSREVEIAISQSNGKYIFT